ncbi:carboxypeptidase Y-deficient [Podochytrium sp. JEL0797]|nr:carboxypeptidase Y-deficient [Podochytrium sp. JEL0797]
MLEQLRKPQVVALYEGYLILKQNVEELLPKFNNLIMALSSQNVIKSQDKEYILATKYRKLLMDYFADIDKLGKRIKSVPTTLPQHQKVQDSIYMAIVQFLQSHMFTLTLMPKVTAPVASTPGSSSPAVKTVVFSDIKRLEEVTSMLDVMEAQEAAIVGQLEDAVRKRRLEDAGALREAVDDVRGEVERLRREVVELGGTV